MATPTFKLSVAAFDGQVDKLDTFLLQCQTQFAFNEKFFDTDKKMVLFLLSRCEEGTAGPWATAWFPKLATYFVGANTWEDFVKNEFRPAFQSQDVVATALAAMKALRMTGTVTIGEYISKYRSYQHQAGLEDSQVPLIKLDFLQGLPIPLSQKVQGVDPTTIDTCKKLYRTAQRFDESWRALNPVRGPRKGTPSTRTNRMSTDTRNKLMKEGRCFFCQEVGHRVNECPKKVNTRGIPTPTPPDAPPLAATITPLPPAPTPASTINYINHTGEKLRRFREAVAELDEETKDEAIRVLEEAGF